MNLKDCVKLKENEKTYLKIKVVTRQPKTEFFGILEDGTLKIRLNALPEKGRANKELIEFVSKELGLNKNSVEIISGASDTIKMLRINS
ncbi:MAG: DUF167 domain-containing protein [Candidatus Gracilibacteria bacterium]|nr:DUF167 domain-containing protein [Candidatus Gracilibacteria bacterium]MDD4530418.1 DUF167 domain-containing protein [Candidatus Gracilibacteria bacterium]